MNAQNTLRAIRWPQSLVVRVVALCAVMVVCLFGTVYVLTVHYYGDIVRHMEGRAASIADAVAIRLDAMEQQSPDPKVLSNVDLSDIVRGKKLDLTFQPEKGAAHISPRMEGSGGVTFEATQYIPFGNGFVQLKVDLDFDPQTEAVRAFQNSYLLALSGGFLAALGLMMYLIVRTLRPIRLLSNSLAEISAGKLEKVSSRGTTSEVRALEDTFNHMVESLRDKERMETSLRQAQRVSALGTLAAGVAHDVRNPLNAIKLLSSHAIDTLGNGEADNAAVKHLRTIRQEVDRLEQIVSGFLSLAKEDDLRRRPCVVDEVLAECGRLVAKDAESRGVRLITDLRCGDIALELDEKQWTRAVLNVLINALEACRAGGRVRLFSRSTDTTCEIEIRDDGPGLSPEVIERVFDPYYTTKPSGTGLGLSITRGIVEEHGGKIAISSESGTGCQVLITLPRREVNAAVPS